MTDKTFKDVLSSTHPTVRKALAALGVTDFDGLRATSKQALRDVAIPGAEKGVGTAGALKFENTLLRDFGISLAPDAPKPPVERAPSEPVKLITAYLRRALTEHGDDTVTAAIEAFRAAA